MIRSLFGKIFTSHIIIIIMITASIGIVLSHLVTEYLIEAKRGELIREGIVATKFLESTLDTPDKLPDLLEVTSELSGARMWIVTKENIIIGNAPLNWNRRFKNREENHDQSAHDASNTRINPHTPSTKLDISKDLLNGEPKSWIRKARDEDDPSIVVAIPFPPINQTALFLYTPIFGITKTANAIQNLLIYSIIASFALAAIFAFFLSRNLTKPMSNISNAAQSFASGNYSSRTTATGTDEIGNLGQTFNTMANALESIEKNRREFFSTVTHELKTPIAAIQALTETILDGLASTVEKRDRYLNTILDETNHMNHLIGELLNLEKLESGQLSFHYQTINLSEFFTSIKEKYTPLLHAKKLSLVIDFAPELKTMHTDPNRLEQILTNLISNAIRHSLADAIITITLNSCMNTITIAVIDHGEGIPAEHLPFIWDRFYRVDKARARSEGGTGLGLAITKQLVEGMGGTITVTSIPYTKTTFLLTLPQS
ncbi:MAG: integral rane sensor signal transduction histidine kinase [Firmicutes bacterium]|nr:integral rane sensor signal transduction histidine kinase [Bacillota bacterium]